MSKSTHEEHAFEGRAGRTRREFIHWTGEGGVARSAQVYACVNLNSDPKLREGLLSAGVQRGEGGEELLVPVVVHDPALQKLILFLPEALRSLELQERAKWLAKLAEETECAVPRYVREPRVAIGVVQLRAVLAEPAGGAKEIALVQRDEAVTKREEAVQLREQRLRERAEAITRREDELTEKMEESEAAVRDAAMQQQELEARLQSIADRERLHADRERGITERERGLERQLFESSAGRLTQPGLEPEQEPVERTRPRELAAAPTAIARPSSLPPPPAPSAPPAASRSFTAPRSNTYAPPTPIAALVPDDDEVEEIEDLEPVATGQVHQASVTAVSAEDVEELPREAVEEVVDDEVEEEIDDEMLEAREDVTGLHMLPDEPESDIPAELRGRELAWSLRDGTELYAHIQPSTDIPTELDLLVQLVPAMAPQDLRALVLLTLVTPSRERFARAALDPREPADRLLLDALRRKCEVSVVLHDDAKKLGSVAIQVPRELNVARILDRSSRLRSEAMPGPRARERACDLPLTLPDGHILLSALLSGENEGNAVATRDALRNLQEAMSPERLDDALVYLSIPRDSVDETLARVLDRAEAHGLALPTLLQERALANGAATDLGALVSTQIATFKKTIASENAMGLDEAAIAENWERLLQLATDNEVALDPETHEQAHDAIRKFRGSSPSIPPGVEVDARRISEAGIPELLLMLEHPRYRRLAAMALAERNALEQIEPLCKAVRKMPRAEVVRVVPRIARMGEEVGDALIDGLSAKKTFVRHAFAMALGQLKLRRAVVPLLHVLLAEQSEVWRDMARVFGSFGNASLRALTRQISDGKGPDDRIAIALAHLAHNGCEEAVTAMKKDPDRRVQRIAEEALSHRISTREREEMVAGKRAVDASDAGLVFARRFIEELEGRAPETDLQSDE
jgi:hypothetical protein